MLRRLALLVVTISSFAVGAAIPSGASVPGLAFTDTGCEGHSDSVARLYTAGLGREPEALGFEYWMSEYTSGRRDLLSMADFFVAGPEFDAKFGSLNQLGVINQMYENVLDRPADDGGLTYWNQRMDDGLTRGELLMSFSESPENITRSGTADPVLGPYNSGLGRAWDCFAESDEPAPAGPALPEDDVDPAGPELPVDNGNPGNIKNCKHFSTQEEAQTWFDFYFPKYGDVSNLDGDDDGVPCESLP